VAWLVSRDVGADSGSGALARVLVGMVAGGVTYVTTLWFLQVPEASELAARLRARRTAP
jgi:hypothetical protein